MLQFSILLVFFLDLVYTGWIFPGNKICSPKHNNLIPFTGFKIYRFYTMEGYDAKTTHHLSLARCDHGSADFEKQFVTKSSIDIDWNRPFCVLKLATKSKNELHKLKENRKLERNTTDGRRSHVDEENSAQTHSNKKGIDKSNKSLEEKLKDETNGKATNKNWDRFVDLFEDLLSPNSQGKVEDPQNVVCYKMARRRRYAKRDILFYMPYTFVGALFECPLSQEEKTTMYRSFNEGGTPSENFEFRCDKSLARPLRPLVAEDSTSQWFETNYNPINPKVIQKIPYLTTASFLDLRFTTTDTPDMLEDKWASQIDVNEDYDYSEGELALISQGLALSADYLHKNLNPKDLSLFFRRLADIKAFSSENLKHFIESISQHVTNSTDDHKLNLLLSSQSKEEAQHHLQNLENIWDARIH